MLPITADAGLATDKVESTGYWLANVTLLALFALYGYAHVVIDHCHHRGYLRPLDLCSQRVFAHILLRLGAASAVAASIALCVVLQWAAGKEESTMSAVGSGHAVNNFAELHASQGALAIVSILLSCYYVRLTFGMWTMIQVTFTLVWTSWIVAYSLDAPREVLAAQCLSSQDLKAKEFCRDHIAFAWVPFVLHFLANTTVFTAVMHRNLRPRVARTSGIAYTLVKGGALLAINSWNMSAGVRSIFLGGTIRAFAWFTAGDIVWLYFYIAFTIYGGAKVMLFDMYEYFNREEFPISFSHAAPPSTEHGNEHEQEIPLVDLPGSPV